MSKEKSKASGSNDKVETIIKKYRHYKQTVLKNNIAFLTCRMYRKNTIRNDIKKLDYIYLVFESQIVNSQIGEGINGPIHRYSKWLLLEHSNTEETFK